MGAEIFVLPEAKIQENTMLVPGTDGGKMSKSKNNIIDIFLPDKALRKQVMGIETDSTPLEEPKDPDSCNVFALYSLMASEKDISAMRKNYTGGGYGYGHAKQALYDLIIELYKVPRERYLHYMNNPEELEEILKSGAAKATGVADGVLSRIRTKLGY